MKQLNNTNIKKLLFLIQIVLFSISVSYGQRKNFNTSNSTLPTNSIKALEWVDGELWIATTKGLVKYNGTTFTTYTSASNPEIVPNDAITSLKYSQGYFLVGSANGLAQRYNNTWTIYKSTTLPTTLTHNFITDIAASNDTFLIGTNTGISRKVGNSSVFTRYNPIFISNQTGLNIRDSKITKLDIDGRYYYASLSATNGSPATPTVLAISQNQGTSFQGQNREDKDYGPIISLSKNPWNELVVFSGNATIGYSLRTVKDNNYNPVNSKKITLPSFTTQWGSMFVNERNNNIWLGLAKDSSFITKYNGSTWSNFNIADKSIRINDILVAPTNVIYVATENGLYILDARKKQTLTFDNIPTQTFSPNGVIELNYSVSSNLPVSYFIAGPVTLDGNTLRMNSLGTVSVTISQPGDEEYLPATSITRTFNIVKANQYLTFTDIVNIHSNDNPFVVYAESSSKLPISTYTVVSGPAFIDGNIVTVYGEGLVTLRAEQDGNSTYNPASIEYSFPVLGPAVISSRVDSKNEHLKVFPNPSIGTFNVEFNNNIDEITLFDALGKKSETIQMPSNGTRSFSINTSLKGIVMVLIKSGDDLYSTKINVE